MTIFQISILSAVLRPYPGTGIVALVIFTADTTPAWIYQEF
jgi:hypothetical protein